MELGYSKAMLAWREEAGKEGRRGGVGEVGGWNASDQQTGPPSSLHEELWGFILQDTSS